MPELLSANKDKERYLAMLRMLERFVVSNFGEEDGRGEVVNVENVVDRAVEIMGELKGQVEGNRQEIYKMKDIFKNLNKNVTQSTLPITKSALGNS